MVDIVELQYATMLSNRLDRFKVKSTNPYRINFRCPFCGDSEKSKSKARGWLIESQANGSLYFNCFNCNESVGNLGNFLKRIDQVVYNDYVAEKYVKKATASVDTANTALDTAEYVKPVFDTHPLKKIKKLSALKADHPAKLYIQKRQIPSDQHYRIYYAPKFMTWINTILPGKFEFKKDEPRIVLPFLDKKGNMFGCAARGFNPNGLRYISIMFDQSKNKVFGLDKVDYSKTYFIVEGAFDSFFLSNAVAAAGADTQEDDFENIENAIYVFDNEPRNKEIHKRIEKLIRKKRKVCIWPSSIEQKDINDMHLAGVSNIEQIIKDNSYSGLEANLKLAAWRKT